MAELRDFNGLKFEAEALQPYGELWRKEGDTSVGSLFDAKVVGNVGEVVEAIKRARVVVLERPILNPYYQFIPGGSDDEDIAHVDSGAGDAIAVQVLASLLGRSVGTSYRIPSDLTAAAKKNIKDLETVVRKASPFVREKYDLERLLENYKRPDSYYSFDYGIDPVTRMPNDLREMQGQLWENIWHAGQDLRFIKREFPHVQRASTGLRDFYRKISATSTGYDHSWSRHGQSVVLAYQNPEDRFFDPDKVVHHFRSPGEALDLSPLHRDFILKSERRYLGTTYEPLSEILERQRGF